MILLIDNYDSFSYNLYQMAGAFDPDIMVVRNDEITVSDIRKADPAHIILSPGPGYPQNAGICIEAVKELGREYPILGVCLGHQAICEAFGGKVGHAKKLMHGKSSPIKADTKCTLFHDLPDKFEAARYHSLAVEADSLPDCLVITAETNDGEIMAVKHNKYDIYGVQFHPESILTPDGATIINNFLKIGQERK